MANETDLVRACINYLNMRGIFAWRQNQGGMKAEYKGKKRFMRFAGAKGISDIIGVLPDGRFLAVECKVGRNKPTDDQRAFLQSVNDSGGLGIVVYDLDELRDWIENPAASDAA